MLGRRTFFKAIGSAILGTAIALKIPDSIIPVVELLENKPDGPVLTYNMLMNAYNAARRSSPEPDLLILPRGLYKATKNYFGETAIDNRIIEGETYGRQKRSNYEYPILWGTI